MPLPIIEMLRRSARLGHLEDLIAYCQVADARSTDTYGLNPLMHAARADQRECVLYLLGQSDPRARSKDGKTALMHAAQSGSESCAPLLLAACDPLAVDRNHRTALIIAATHNRLGCARLLAPRSVFCARDLNGRTALAHACVFGFEPMSMLLLQLADLTRDMPAIAEAMALARATHNQPIADAIQRWLDSDCEARDLASEIRRPGARPSQGSMPGSGPRQRL